MTYCTCLYSTISISFYVYKNCTFASYTLYTNVAINHASGKPLYSIAVMEISSYSIFKNRRLS